MKALACLVIGAAGFAATGIGARPATAASEPGGGRTYAASAEAEGLRLTFEAPQFLIVSTLLDAANPISQATLESTGVSRSFASAPYPGDLVVTAPGTVAGFGGPSLPAQYPFFVAASHPDTPKAAVDDPAGAYALSATAVAEKSAASGRLSVPKGPTVHTDSLTETLGDGTVRATAGSVTEGLVAGDGVLTIGRVTSTLEVTSRAGAAQPEVVRHFEISGAKVGDTAVEITPDGVRAGRGVVPVGSAAAPVQQVLSQAGLDVHLEGNDALQGGGTAGTLVIRSHQQAPLPGAPNGVLTIRVGGASAAILTGPAAVVDLPGSLGALPPGSYQPASDPVAGTGESPAASGTGSPAGSGSGNGSGLGGSFGTPGPGASQIPAGSLTPGGETATDAPGGSDTTPRGDGVALGPDALPIRSVPTSGPVRRAVRILFAVLAVGGALALAGATTFRRQGVHSTWTF